MPIQEALLHPTRTIQGLDLHTTHTTIHDMALHRSMFKGEIVSIDTPGPLNDSLQVKKRLKEDTDTGRGQSSERLKEG